MPVISINFSTVRVISRKINQQAYLSTAECRKRTRPAEQVEGDRQLQSSTIKANRPNKYMEHIDAGTASV
jgi:hypothetical protein